MEKNKDLLFIQFNIGNMFPEDVNTLMKRIANKIKTDYVKEHYEVFVIPVIDGDFKVTAIPSNLSIPSDMLGDSYEKKLDDLIEVMKKMDFN